MLKINNFTLEAEPAARDRFCLKETFVSRGKDGKAEPKDSVRTLGYGMTLVKCLRIIAHTHANEFESVSIHEWQKAYEKKMDNLINELKPLAERLYEYDRSKAK